MSKSNNYNPDYYIKNNEKSIYDKHLNNQEYSSNKEKDFPTFTPVSIKQPQLSQPQELIQLPSSQQSLPNINNMLNYELNNINEETDNNLLKKSKLQKTFYKLPTASYLKKSNQIDDDYNLIIRQQPAYARCSNFNDKERRPIDPPPIIQLVFGNEYMDDSSTNYFIKCEFH
ncbi:hypothetical protein H8356DRAFT_1074918 [Neocallimastix lanati (nom. inval.)]|nr:hypothetical protein H8356DRAFT_1074918 [Neocallimastix sp. JGI-2020a]